MNDAAVAAALLPVIIIGAAYTAGLARTKYRHGIRVTLLIWQRDSHARYLAEVQENLDFTAKLLANLYATRWLDMSLSEQAEFKKQFNLLRGDDLRLRAWSKRNNVITAVLMWSRRRGDKSLRR